MRIHSLLAFLLAAGACAPAAARAQTQADSLLRPGSAQVDGRVIPEGVESLMMYVDPGNRRMDASITLRTRLATVDGTEAIVRTETFWQGDEVVQVDSFVLHRETLAPLSRWSAGPQGLVRVEFVPGMARTARAGEWGRDSAEVPLPQPVFLAGTTDMLLGALPLREGYSARLAVYNVDEGVTSIDISVVGQEQVALPSGGRAAAWEVEVREAGPPVTYWVDRESHTLVQYASEGGVIRFVREPPGPQRRRETR
ncbi:MAG TPA: hypothetical protein VHG08_08950 [Longimicrobium sp.]|nr:hypothetical protein [Longimicrobium sp.]